MSDELQRWRERQLDVYQRAQVIEHLEQTRLRDEYQHSQVIGRMDQQVAGLSQLGIILADTSQHVGWIEADIARLLAVTDRYLPAIVNHLALVCERLADIAKMLATPRETQARELFKTGTRALASAAEMSEKGSQGLAEEWLDEAIHDLTQATETYPQRPEFWYHLGLALARRGPSRDAADKFSRCARYALADNWPGLAAQAVLLAAAELRSTDNPAAARELLHRFLPVLDTCAEIYLSLAIHHGETSLLEPALRRAPLLAAAVRAEIDILNATAVDEVTPPAARRAAAQSAADLADAGEAAAAEVCRSEDGPVARLRRLQNAARALIDASNEYRLDLSTNGFTLDDPHLADFGIDVLLLAERRMHETVGEAGTIAAEVRAGLSKLENRAQASLRRVDGAKWSGQQAIRAGLAQGQQDKERARRSADVLERELPRARERAALAQKAREAWGPIPENGELQADICARIVTLNDDMISYCMKDLHGGHGMYGWRDILNTLLGKGPLGGSGFGPDEYPVEVWIYSEEARRLPEEGDLWGRMVNLAKNGSSVAVPPGGETFLMLAGRDEIIACFEDAEQELEDATIRLQRAREEVDVVNAKADRKLPAIEQQAENEVLVAEAEYSAARDHAARAAETLERLLVNLDAVATASSSRDRIIPSASKPTAGAQAS